MCRIDVKHGLKRVRNRARDGLRCVSSGSWIWPALGSLAVLTHVASAAVNYALDRAQIVITEHPGVTVNYSPGRAAVSNMVVQGVTQVTGKTNATEAWQSLVATNETVGLKVFSRPGAISGTRLPVVEAVVQGLLASGLPPTNIVIWDHHLADLRLAGYSSLERRFGVALAGSAESGYDSTVFYDTPLLGKLVWGDVEFGESGPGVGRRSYPSRLVLSGFKKIISIVPLLNNNETAVSGHCWGLTMASVDNTLRFQTTPGRLAEAVPELLALPGLDLRDRLVLAVTDAILCQFQGEERQLLHYSTPLDQLWFGTDPVALDVLAIDAIERQRTLRSLPGRAPERILYENCSLLQLGVSSTNRIDVSHLRLAVP